MKSIRNAYYEHDRGFVAYERSNDARPDHTTHNDNYIPIRNVFVLQFDYPAQLQHLIDHCWQRAVTPTNRPGTNIRIGSAKPVPATPEVVRPKAPALPPTDWATMKLFEQVAAYAFRGDRRSPDAIIKDGGFNPPSMRNDEFYAGTVAKRFAEYMAARFNQQIDQDEILKYILNPVNRTRNRTLLEYSMWRNVLKNEEMHLSRMTDDSFLKGYISTTRDVNAARLAGDGSLGGGDTAAGSDMDFAERYAKEGGMGWVYAIRVRSGFLVKKGIGGVVKQEAEIAHLGPIEWKDIIGFAAVRGTHAYLRNDFHMKDHLAARQILASLTSLLKKPPLATAPAKKSLGHSLFRKS